jgi:hypothetical protein
MTDTPDPWGPYRATIEDRLDTCADYLDRLRRSLAGEIAPDRHYFADKAHEVHTAARRMLRIVQDIDRWLGECPATIEHVDTDGARFISECALPAGHQGSHDDSGRLLAGRCVTGELRDLADAVDRISEGFGWTAPDVDRDIAGAPGPIATATARSPAWPPASTPSPAGPADLPQTCAAPRPVHQARPRVPACPVGTPAPGSPSVEL